MVFTVRNFTWDDFTTLMALIRSVPGDPQQEIAQDEQFAKKWLGQPGCYPERDYFLAFDGDQAAGYSHVNAEFPIGRAIISGAVHSHNRRHGLGRQLLSVAMDHARSMGLRYAHAPTSPEDVVAHRFLTRAGFAQIRAEWHMTRNSSVVISQDLPDGYTVRHLRTGEERILVSLQNDAFAENWGFCPNTVEQVTYWLHLPGYSMEGALLLMQGDEPVAYCWTRTSTSSQEPVGVIWMTGVSPQRRGMGLGRIIVVEGLRYLTNLDLPSVNLTVDEDNLPARQLYTSLGFCRVNKTQWYEAAL